MAAPAEATVLGVALRPRTRREALQTIHGWLAGRRPRSVYFVHAATANLAFEDPAYRAALNRGDMVLHDGAGVRWAARAAGVALAENLVGTDLVPELLAGPFAPPLRVFLLGGRQGVAAGAARYIARRFPGIEVVGFAAGYFAPAEEAALVDHIRRLAPELVLVAMGNPRQELFLDRNLDHLGCRVAIAVGGLFDHFAGELRRAPPWMRRVGLEWLQLLAQQPHKWRRYLLGIPRFLWRIFGRRLRRWLAAFTVALLSFVIALAGAEALVRAVRPQILERHPEGFYVASAGRQYQMRPHFRGVFRYPEFQTEVRLNGQGLREDRDYGPPPLIGRRILVLGDSFTMGYSVEQERTWVRRLEALLGPAYELINAGVPGYSTRQELVYLEREGLALEPSIVQLGFFVGNDIVDNAPPLLPVALRDGLLVAAPDEEGLLPLDLRLAVARRSNLYHLSWPVQRAWRGYADPKATRRYAAYEGRAEDGWRATAGLLDRMARLCRGARARLILVIIPERAQVERLLPVPLDPRMPNRRLAALCRAAGIETVDLLDSLAGPGLYFPQDGHWTERGNEAAAHVLAAYLSQTP